VKRACIERQCPEPATYRGRCKGHARRRDRDTHRNKAIYNSKRWRVLRKRRLFLDPLCGCGEIATDVDHKVPIEDGGDAFNLENTQSLCASCHGQKTRREQA
jgi:5-methylcytosine-specific restriction endonuclease McrA